MAMSAKQKGKEQPKLAVTLERVLGLTIPSNASMSLDPVNGVLAYPAGCVVVLFNPETNTQKHIFNACRKIITSVDFSPDGKYVATGESGKKPAVRVWDVADQSQRVEFIYHDFEIVLVKFSPDLTHLVSIGSENDKTINVWNWKSGVKVASNKVVNKIHSVAFFRNDPAMFTTVGLRYLKIWTIGTVNPRFKLEVYAELDKYLPPAVLSKARPTIHIPLRRYDDSNEEHRTQTITPRAISPTEMMNTGTVPLSNKGFGLKDLFKKRFCEVTVVDKFTYVITKAGDLYKFNEKKQVEKTTKLKKSNCMCAGKDFVFVGCQNGVVEVLDSEELSSVTTLPLPHHLGIDVACDRNIDQQAQGGESKHFADTIAIVFDERRHRLTCVYNDHSMYIWDVKDIHRVEKLWSNLYHSSEIMALEVEQTVFKPESLVLPPGSFITSSADDTIRIWNIDPNMRQYKFYKRNIHSKELLKVIYADSKFSRLKDVGDQTPKATHGPHQVQVEFMGGLGGHTLGPSAPNHDLPRPTMTEEEMKRGVSSINISPDSTHLASGDMNGNVRIYDLRDHKELPHVKPLKFEIMCLQYSDFKTGSRFLAAGDRRQHLRVYDAENDYSTIQSITDHKSRITAIKFTSSDDQHRLLSSSADKSVIFRKICWQDNRPHFERESHHVMDHNTLYDMDIDDFEKEIVVACQDRNIRSYDIKTSKQKKCFNGTVGDKPLVRLHLDPSGQYVITSSLDKHICMVDLDSGEMVASMYGHSEDSRGVKFMKDLRHAVSVSGDSCIFVWRLPVQMTKKMKQRLEELGRVPIQAVSIHSNLKVNKEINVKSQDPLLDDDEPAPTVADAETKSKIPIGTNFSKTFLVQKNSPQIPEETVSKSEDFIIEDFDEQSKEDEPQNERVEIVYHRRNIDEAVEELKKAVKKCTLLYDEVTREKSPESEKVQSILQDVFGEMTEMMKIRSPKLAFDSTPSPSSTNPIDQLSLLQQMQRYNDELIDRVENVLTEKLGRKIQEVVDRCVKEAMDSKYELVTKPHEVVNASGSLNNGLEGGT